MNKIQSFDEFVNESSVEILESKLNEDDDEGNADMARGQLMSIVRISKKLAGLVDYAENIPAWAAAKITIAEHNVDAVYGYMMGEYGDDESVDEYAESKPGGIEGGGFEDPRLERSNGCDFQGNSGKRRRS